MTKSEAHEIMFLWEIPINRDFHALNSETVDRIIAAADERKYRKPKNANGSRARYFYAYLNRVCNRGNNV